MPKKLLIISIFLLVLIGCNNETLHEAKFATLKKTEHVIKQLPNPPETTIQIEDFQRNTSEWGENVTGVKHRFQTNKQQIALTFDACGGPNGSQYDEELITFLIEEKIPATLFVNEQWIIANEALFLTLAEEPLFQIENHGTDHLPLSVNGGEAWGIPATTSAEAAYEEIMGNHETVRELIGKEMKYFRSGTAYYDEVAVELANALGYQVVNYDILGDAGATFTSTQVENALLQAEAGSIALLHMNQPQSGTAEGVINAVPKLREQGFEFVRLDEVILK